MASDGGFAVPPPRAPGGSNLPTWDQYFKESLDLNIPDTEDVFRVYRGGEGPCTFVLIHG